MIPTCITLEQRQLDKLKRFEKFVVEQVGVDRWEEAAHADDTGASPLVFRIFATGIGDVIAVRALGYHCDLSIDDSDELSPDEFPKIS